MATLKAMFRILNGYTGPMTQIINKSNLATDKILRASGATDKLNSKLESTGASATAAGAGLISTGNSAARVNAELEETAVRSGTAASGLTKFLRVAAIAVPLITALSLAAVKGMGIADEYTNTSSRLNLINDGMQTQLELQNKIHAAANRSRGVYSDMAGAVAKLGLLAGESFTSNDETIAFTELMQKSFKISGASSSEQSSGMYQLTQAMAAGKLQGDEFRSIMENAPMLADAIAKFTGKSKGELKEMSSDGEITADIIKGALFASADDIEAKFSTMPMTFADIWNRIKNGTLKAFSPLIEAVSKIINSSGFQIALDGIFLAIMLISTAVNFLATVITDGWAVIWPILAAIAIYLAATLLPGFIAAGIAGLIAGYQIAAGWIMANLPMLATIALIALIIYSLTQAGVTFEDIFGFIGGVIGVFVTFFYNKFVYIWNMVAAFINFLGNAFNDPVSAVKILFYDLMVNVLGFIENMAQGIEDLLNAIPGVEVNITGSLTKLKNDIADKSAALKDKSDWVDYVKSKEFMDYSEGYAKGSKIGKDVANTIGDKLSGLVDSLTGENSGSEYDPTVIEGTGNNGKVDVSMDKEDIGYLRDLAEREFVNKFSTATLAPKISVKFTGAISKEADTDAMYSRISKLLNEQIAIAAEGAHI